MRSFRTNRQSGRRHWKEEPKRPNDLQFGVPKTAAQANSASACHPPVETDALLTAGRADPMYLRRPVRWTTLWLALLRYVDPMPLAEANASHRSAIADEQRSTGLQHPCDGGLGARLHCRAAPVECANADRECQLVRSLALASGQLFGGDAAHAQHSRRDLRRARGARLLDGALRAIDGEHVSTRRHSASGLASRGARATADLQDALPRAQRQGIERSA